MSQQLASIAIGRHHRLLRFRGVRLGTAQGGIIDAGHGGFYQVFQSGRIYWHRSTGAHEVHGGILRKYLDLGGHDRNPATGKRELGFPTTDERPTRDGRRRVSEMEWGAVYWIHGGVAVHGRIWQSYKAKRELGVLGYPVAQAQRFGTSESQLFESGCMIDRAELDAPLLGRLRAPMLGRPGVVQPDSTELPIAVNFSLTREQWATLNEDPSSLMTPWRQRLRLRPVGGHTVGSEIVLEAEVKAVLDQIPDGLGVKALDEEKADKGHTADPRLKQRRQDDVGNDPNLPDPEDVPVRVSIGFKLPAGTELADRTLYDLVIRTQERRTVVVRAHSLYAKSSWANFGYLHATDLHVSRRLDKFAARLRRAGRAVSAEEFSNCNNNFRDLIRKANALHAQGKIDMVVATGDLVDYIFEKGDHERGGGNFALFEDLVRGQSAYPDARPSRHEALKVPIFTSLGNHDYRGYPYELHFELDIPGPNRMQSHYGPFNLTEEDAIAVQGGRVPKLDPDQALPSVVPIYPEYYVRKLNDSPSYVVDLGPHRLVMIDTGPDANILSGIGDALEHLAGLSDEDEESFADGSPNSEGVRSHDIINLRRALQDADEDGLVIVGMHAPPLNVKKSETPHYFRETEHRQSDEKETVEFLARHDGRVAAGVVDAAKKELAKRLHPTWPLTGTGHFKSGSTGDLLDSGVSRGEIEQFMQLCLGRGTGISRPVDLVLFGHIHRHVEFRTEWSDAADQIRYFFDFYMENPRRYYASKKKGFNAPVHVEISDRARPGGVPSRVRDRRPGAIWHEWQNLRVPSNRRTLDRAPSKRDWWQANRPLFVQSAPLGPIDKNQRKDLGKNKYKPSPAFQGSRLITVRNNAMTEVTLLPTNEIAPASSPRPRPRPQTGTGVPRPRTRAASVVVQEEPELVEA